MFKEHQARVLPTLDPKAKRLEPPLVKKIVVAWLGILKLELDYNVDGSDLDLDVEKFVALDDHSMLSYIIGHKLIKEVSIYTSFIIVIVSIESMPSQSVRKQM